MAPLYIPNCLLFWQKNTVKLSKQNSDTKYFLNVWKPSFQDIVEGEEFTAISESKLVELISSEDLVVDKEETVFHACLTWLKVNLEVVNRTKGD